MNKKLIYFAISALILAFILLQFKTCNNIKPNNLKPDSIIVVTVDSIKITDTLFKSKLAYITDTTYVIDSFFVYQNDSNLKFKYDSLIKSYYSKNIFTDTFNLSKDTFNYGNLVIRDTVQKNKISNRTYFANFTIPQITKTITIKNKPMNNIYAGVGVSYTSIAYVDVNLLYTTKTRSAYSFSVGKSSSNIKYTISAYYKIK